MLVGRPIGQGSTILLGLKKDLSKEDMEIFRREMDNKMDLAQQTVKAMPKSLFLVMRNVNLVRAICVAHGNPNDRYTVFSRIAAKVAVDDSGINVTGSSSLVDYSEAVVERVYFEWMLFVNYLYTTLFGGFIRILSLFGLLPTMPDGRQFGGNGGVDFTKT